MFFRTKKSGPRTYLQIVENRWADGRTKQRVLATLGRLDQLGEGKLESLLESGSRFADHLLVLNAYQQDKLTSVRTRRIGPALVFERLWQETGCRDVLEDLLAERRFEFPVERAVFVEVLHRLIQPGSDHACYTRWLDGHEIDGANQLQLHHSYRAMAWLGEQIEDQDIATPFAPRCTKDLIEETLFERRRDLFSSLDLVYVDTTSIYFEGEGGESLGQHGHSKDHRPDLKQMVVAAVLDGEGHPVCCELWPGNTTDVNALIPVQDRIESRFGIETSCLVADRGMVSAKTLGELEERYIPYIVGTRMKAVKEIREEVLSRSGRYQEVHPPRSSAKDPSPLKVKEVWVQDRRYIVCLNEEQARKDREDREAILASLEQALTKGATSLVGNKGYRRYLRAVGKAFRIDDGKVERDAAFDGKWVLRTNTELEAAEVALKYKQLWVVEEIFRSLKSLLATRPIWHKTDAPIRGHVFCSLLAMLLRKQLQDRLEACGQYGISWSQLIADLDRLDQTEIDKDGDRYLLRSELVGVTGKVFQAVGVAVPPTLRKLKGQAA